MPKGTKGRPVLSVGLTTSSFRGPMRLQVDVCKAQNPLKVRGAHLSSGEGSPGQVGQPHGFRGPADAGIRGLRISGYCRRILCNSKQVQ